MKKYIIIACISMLAATLVKAQQEGIQFFEGTWEEATAKSIKENKLIFIDCNTSWCGPCKVLAKDVFTQKKMGDFYNRNFINVSMDMEKGPGPELAKKFHLAAYPTMFYLKPNGQVISSVTGLKDADTLLISAEWALRNRNQLTLVEQFCQGRRDTAFLRQFFTTLIVTQPPGSQAHLLDTVVAQEGYEALYQPKYFQLLPLANANSPVWKWFLSHYRQFCERLGEDAVNEKIADRYTSRTILRTLEKGSKRDSTVFTQYRQHMESEGIPGISFINSVIDFYINCADGNFSQGVTQADAAMGSRPKAWQLHLMSRWADWLLIGRFHERFEASKWACKAAEMRNSPIDIKECKAIADDLLNSQTPVWVYPSPRVYGLNIL